MDKADVGMVLVIVGLILMFINEVIIILLNLVGYMEIMYNGLQLGSCFLGSCLTGSALYLIGGIILQFSK